jgi:hypothetical protein
LIVTRKRPALFRGRHFEDVIILLCVRWGSVANTERGDANGRASYLKLRGDSKDGVDKLALRYRIALSDPADLTLADCMHRLIALDGSTSSVDRSESEACRNPLLDETVVLLDDIV